eukprot:jgi/Astpho2/2642/fgenesh1_pm.00049_%23_6_t
MEDPAWHGDMAKQYPFTLDPFQSTAVACLERRESVLVSAHTSAGKTAVAEYAIAMAFRDKQKVIYTSPLKALSNQKFRELSEEFNEDVGLMTGDVSIKPNSTCMVMTTEILRSMLYRGSELLREVAWVIFDEVHYMQDRERGVVWEETIIFLPKEVRMVFLSATLSNASQFAGWVASLHFQPCHVVYTDYRPTPLQHYAFPVGGSGMFLVKDQFGNFKTENFAELRMKAFGATDSAESKAANGIEQAPARDGGGGRGARGRGGRGDRGHGGRGGGRGGGGDNTMAADIYKVLRGIKGMKGEPVIIFSFARRECEQYALFMKGKQDLDFTTDEEKEAVREIFEGALSVLKDEDRELPFLGNMLPLLVRGIGVHHSGLLPILKEVVELLFQEQLIKCLFATETFAMGLNMPAKTCIFTSLRKFDGVATRWIESGEYIQMSGRAGRRGKDPFGMCIMMVDEAMDEATCREMTTGKPSPLISSFKLTYYTLLNVMRRLEGSGHDMEYVIKRSFSQFQHEQQVPKLQEELEGLQKQADNLGAASEAALQEYQSLKQPDKCLHFLRPGRLVQIEEGQLSWGWGVVVSVMRRALGANAGAPAAEGGASQGVAAEYQLDLLLGCTPDSIKAQKPLPAAKTGAAEMHVLPARLTAVTALSSLRISIPTDLRTAEARRATWLTIKDLDRQFPEGIPRLDPVEDMQIEDAGMEAAVRAIEKLEGRLAANEVFKAQRDSARYISFERKAALAEQAEALKRQMKESQLSSFRTEAKARTAVLRKLGMIDGEGVVQIKGKAACEIDTADELLATELMLDGTFSGLDKHQLVALVSCLVPGEKSQEQIHLTTTLSKPLAKLQETARMIAEVSTDCRLDVDADEYVDTFKPYSMDIVYQWSQGAKFGDICANTDKFEGSVVREMRRLDELMRNLELAAKVIGEEDLASKIAESADTIRRDIIFAASLYI